MDSTQRKAEIMEIFRKVLDSGSPEERELLSKLTNDTSEGEAYWSRLCKPYSPEGVYFFEKMLNSDSPDRDELLKRFVSLLINSATPEENKIFGEQIGDSSLNVDRILKILHS